MRYTINAEEIETLIREQGLKRYWLAQAAGVDRTTLRRWMAGRIQRVQEERLTRLASVLGCDPSRIGAPIGGS